VAERQASFFLSGYHPLAFAKQKKSRGKPLGNEAENEGILPARFEIFRAESRKGWPAAFLLHRNEAKKRRPFPKKEPFC
jgi:hypothetical protein